MAMQIFVNRNCQTLIFSFLYIIEGYIQQQYFSSGGGGGVGEVWNTGHFPQITDYRSLRYR